MHAPEYSQRVGGIERSPGRRFFFFCSKYARQIKKMDPHFASRARPMCVRAVSSSINHPNAAREKEKQTCHTRRIFSANRTPLISVGQTGLGLVLMVATPVSPCGRQEEPYILARAAETTEQERSCYSFSWFPRLDRSSCDVLILAAFSSAPSATSAAQGIARPPVTKPYDWLASDGYGP
jgi:hypothetical protein